jgi:hypothetical protein
MALNCLENRDTSQGVTEFDSLAFLHFMSPMFEWTDNGVLTRIERVRISPGIPFYGSVAKR